MVLTPGTRLGPYEIVSVLGAGGMGQVYRAADTRLKRHVAIKVLPPALAADADRLARFQREAEVLAALNHPNIAHIHGLEDSGGSTALVMELVEGEDLSARLQSGALPIDEAIAMARQIADALEAAHEQGIVHRDLKPLNIRVRPDGAVKVLDFGLAKALDTSDSNAAKTELANSPTRVGPVTASGIILGTAAYMSPEQARGRQVDKRTDIWAFGCVLFEMLTGSRLFAGESAAETLALVFSREPDLTMLPAATPARVRTLLARCLVKDPKQRLRDIGDARLALDGAFDSGASHATSSSAATPASAAPELRTRLLWPVVAAVAVASAIALAVPALRHLGETAPPAPPETRLEIVTPPTDRPTDFALSPDGSQIVFGAKGDGVSRLWLRSLGTTTAQSLAGTEGGTFPFWSPDGRSIGFFAGAALKRLDFGGGAPQILAPVTLGTGGTWNTDGVILFAPNNATTGMPVMRVSSTGGAVQAVTTIGPQQGGHSRPFFLPDGRRFLFGVDGAADVAGIYLGSLDGGLQTRLVPSDTGGVWLESGWLLWVRTGTRTLIAQRLDLDHAMLIGDPVPVAEGVAVVSATGSLLTSAVSVSRTGLIAFLSGSANLRQLRWTDRAGTVIDSVGDPDTTLLHPRISPDGRRVLMTRSVQGNQDVWAVDSTRVSRLTFDPASDSFPLWSPDGASVVFSSRRNGPNDLFQKPVSGAGAEELLIASDQTKVPFSWSADGRFLFYSSYDPKTNADLWVLSMTGERTPSVVLKTPFRETQPMISPDGRWLAHLSDQSGRNEVYIRPFVAPGSAQPSEEVQWQVSTAGGIYPTWRRDGNELYFLDPSGAMMAVSFTVSGNTPELGSPTRLFQTSIFGGGVDSQQGRSYDVGPDGRFLINTLLPGGQPPLTLIQNWNPTPAAR